MADNSTSIVEIATYSIDVKLGSSTSIIRNIVR